MMMREDPGFYEKLKVNDSISCAINDVCILIVHETKREVPIATVVDALANAVLVLAMASAVHGCKSPVPEEIKAKLLAMLEPDNA